MTYRQLLNNLSDEEFAQTIIDDVLLHMCCSCSVVDNQPACPYEVRDCFKCLVKLLQSDVEDLTKI